LIASEASIWKNRTVLLMLVKMTERLESRREIGRSEEAFSLLREEFSRTLMLIRQSPNISASAYASDPRAVKIADAAKRLNELREAWLNPPDLVQRVPEVAPGFPDRILPVDDKAAAILKKTDSDQSL
jgi:hypothetical protein